MFARIVALVRPAPRCSDRQFIGTYLLRGRTYHSYFCTIHDRYETERAR